MAAPSWNLRGAVMAALASALLFPATGAHEHDISRIQQGQTVSEDPIDTALWVHVFIQMFAFGVVFPVGMVLGIVKSRWHVPTQTVGTILAIVGYFLGHNHGGRQFIETNVHANFADWLNRLLILQVAAGAYLKLHLERGINAKIRRVVRPCHSILGKSIPILSWVQMIFGGITALGFCQGDHLGQCLAHFIMGSAFIAYGILLTILLFLGQLWLRRTGRSQEFFDSVIIAAWGCVNTFTEHHWGTAWVRNDWQHTTMGIIWWCAGLAGVWLSRDHDGNPKRNFIPGFVILITGWGMSAHPQDLPISAMTHRIFGYTLMAAGLTRIIEVSFVVKDQVGVSDDGRQYNSFQLIPVFLLYASGFLFMGATEEQLSLVASSGLDHVSYILILYSFSFLLFLFVNMLINLYDRNAASTEFKNLPNGHAVEERQLQDAEEFELDGLVSEEEEDEGQGLLQKGGRDDAGLGSPSTLGRNNEATAR